jgi:hypothetical protein
MSPPPYEMRDKATGEVVPGFGDMDTEPGKFIEVYSGDAAGSPSTRISGTALERPGGEEPPIEPPVEPPITPPTGDDGMDRIDNETQLRDALMTYADEQRVGICYSKVPITLTKTIILKQERHNGSVWGFNANHMNVCWAGPGGEHMIEVRGVNGQPNRMFFAQAITLSGNGYSGARCGDCFRMYAPDGDPGALYKFTLRDIFTNYGTYGITLRGAVYEGFIENCHAENHSRDGLLQEHLNLGSPTQAIVSNVAVLHPNFSRNKGAGMRQVYSCNSIFGSYVLNAEGGIIAPDGLRYVGASNGENTGESVFKIGWNGYGTVVASCEGSTNVSTVYREWTGTEWVDVGKPLRYVIDDNKAGVPQAGNHISTYGGDGNVAVVKP